MLLMLGLLKKLLEHLNIEDNPQNLKIVLSIIIAIIFVVMIIAIIYVVAEVKMFMLAGKGGWECLIPFYYDYTKFKIVWGIGWLFPIAYIPILKYLVFIITNIKVCKVYNRDTVGNYVGMFLIPHIFMFIIAFSKNTKYLGIEKGKLFNKYI